MTARAFAGTTTTDPLTGLPVGAQINFAPVEFQGSDATNHPQSVRNWDAFHGALLGFALKSTERLELVGTAVLVAPGLAITATHNFREELKRLQAGEVQIYCFGIRLTGADIWKVVEISFTDEDDISYLSLEAVSAIPPDNTYHQFALTTRAPKNGETLHIIGFRAETLPDSEISSNSFDSVSISSNIYTARGAVVAVYPKGRDRTLIPYPVIELNCGSLGGMSGGAVIDSSGHLIGVISRGLETEDNLGPTYVSWAVMSLGRIVKIPWPSGFYVQPISVLSIDRRIMFIERPEALTVNESGMINYSIWFE